MTANNRKPWPPGGKSRMSDEHMLVGRSNGNAALALQIQNGKALLMEVTAPQSDTQLLCQMAATIDAALLTNRAALFSAGAISLEELQQQTSPVEVAMRAMAIMAVVAEAEKHGLLAAEVVKAQRLFADPRDQEEKPKKPELMPDEMGPVTEKPAAQEGQ